MPPRIYLSPPDLAGTELAMLTDAVESGWVAPLGPHVDAFERELATRCGVDHALALSSGTAALHLALLVLGVGAGDEVWLSTLTFAATANAVAYVGATPVFVDSDEATWNLDPALLAEELAAAARRGKLPRALIVVDLYGQCAELEPIVAACRQHGVAVIEDAAEALGATYQGRPAGSFGDLSILSFNGNKIITTSGGGALLGHDRKLLDAPATWRPRPGPRCATTSTRTSATTTACPTCWPRSAGPSSATSTAGSRRAGRSSLATAPAWPTYLGGASCPRRPATTATAG